VISALIEKDKTLVANVSGYQKLVGKLIYLSHTRPDIAYAVHFLSQFMHEPLNVHLQVALRLLRYLKNSPGKGILFTKGSSFEPIAYADSDWGKCTSSRKSVSGYCVFLGKCLVEWRSKKQRCVSRSTAEAEYRSMCDASCDVLWLLNVLAELNISVSLPINLFCDNTAAISIAANPVFHNKTKHFELDLYFLREKISSGVIKTVGVKTDNQLADIFTKGLLPSQHKVLCSSLGLYDPFENKIEAGC
jgi:hypothetical protein